MIWSGICYPDDICKLLVLLIVKRNEDRNDVVQSDFEEDSDDVMKKMNTNHVFKSLSVDTS